MLCFVGTTVKVVCSIQKLLELTGQTCRTEGCTAKLSVKYVVTGCTISISCICDNQHCFMWKSSDELVSQAHGHIYVDNIHFASCLILSGNHYSKFETFARFFGLQIIKRSTYHVYQRNLICPAVNKFYHSQQVLNV